jgi:hypothetical protein
MEVNDSWVMVDLMFVTHDMRSKCFVMNPEKDARDLARYTDEAFERYR